VADKSPGLVQEAITYCQCDKIQKKLVYSRGNNEPAQLDLQFDKSGKKSYQYETARIELMFTGDPFKSCICKDGECIGEFELQLEMKVLNLLDPADQILHEPTAYALLNGVEVTGGTTRTSNTPPAPNVNSEPEETNYPKPAGDNVFVKPDRTKRDYTAKAKTSVPCKPGKYLRRFLIADKNWPGGKRSGSFYVDATIEVKKKEGEICKLIVSVEGNYLEYHPGFKWHEKGGAELPEVNTPTLGVPKTRNIAKLIEECGKKIDEPFSKCLTGNCRGGGAWK